MEKIIIINGPNLNLLGARETDIYGDQSFEDYFQQLISIFPKLGLTYYQSNHEGDLIDKLHETGFSHTGIIINAGAFTHTSLALGDAIAGITAPVVEVHISNVHGREKIRHHSLLAKNCKGVISGFGLDSYRLAVLALTTG